MGHNTKAKQLLVWQPVTAVVMASNVDWPKLLIGLHKAKICVAIKRISITNERL